MRWKIYTCILLLKNINLLDPVVCVDVEQKRATTHWKENAKGNKFNNSFFLKVEELTEILRNMYILLPKLEWSNSFLFLNLTGINIFGLRHSYFLLSFYFLVGLSKRPIYLHLVQVNVSGIQHYLAQM